MDNNQSGSTCARCAATPRSTRLRLHGALRLQRRIFSAANIMHCARLNAAAARRAARAAHRCCCTRAIRCLISLRAWRTKRANARCSVSGNARVRARLAPAARTVTLRCHDVCGNAERHLPRARAVCLNTRLSRYLAQHGDPFVTVARTVAARYAQAQQDALFSCARTPVGTRASRACAHDITTTP